MLKQLVADNGISISKLVKKVGISRSSFYNHIEDPNLSVDILIKYGQILHVDILELITDKNDLQMKDAISYYPLEEEPKEPEGSYINYSVSEKKVYDFVREV